MPLDVGPLDAHMRAFLPAAWLTDPLGACVAFAYAIDFANARAWYGTLAGVHAWAEFPALALVLTLPRAVCAGRDRSTIR